MTTPFAIVYDHILNTLLADPVISGFKAGNVVNFNTENRTPYKEKISPADLPELALLASSTATPSTMANSCDTALVYAYTVIVVTGEQSAKSYLFPLQWAMYRALIKANTNIGGLVYDTQLGFAKDSKIIGGTAALADLKANRSIRGWSFAWRLEVPMQFNLSRLLEEYS